MTSFVRSISRPLVVAGGILLLAGVHNASAQVTDAVKFKTSFPFTVGNATMPAGSYMIRPDDSDPLVLQLIGPRGSVFFETENATPRETPAKSEVVFKRYGDGYVLKDIWVAGPTEGAEVVAGHGERHAAKRHPSATEHRVAATTKAAGTKTATANHR
jgi:hypothetical protein